MHLQFHTIVLATCITKCVYCQYWSYIMMFKIHIMETEAQECITAKHTYVLRKLLGIYAKIICIILVDTYTQTHTYVVS